MPKPNYDFERRQREKEKAEKAMAKKRKRLEPRESKPEDVQDAPTVGPEDEVRVGPDAPR